MTTKPITKEDMAGLRSKSADIMQLLDNVASFGPLIDGKKIENVKKQLVELELERTRIMFGVDAFPEDDAEALRLFESRRASATEAEHRRLHAIITEMQTVFTDLFA